MNKKLLIIFIICLFSLTMVKQSYAGPVLSGFFNDSESSLGNTFSASTLFFTITDAGDNPLPAPYFDILDMKPEDSQTKTIRVKKGGIEDFKYNLSFNKTNGDDILCNALKIEAKLEGTTVYNGNLSSLTIDPTPTISSGGTDQWEITISLSDSSSDLKDKTCLFDLTFKGWQTNSDGGWGFKDEHSINNNVATGTWELLSSPNPDQGQTDQPVTILSDQSGTEENQDNLSPTPASNAADATPTPAPTPTPTPDESSNSDDSTATQVDGEGEIQ
jgi:hypothetical protein